MIDKVSNLRNTGCASLPSCPGVYCWWWDEEGKEKLLAQVANQVDVAKLHMKIFNDKTYYALYYGSSRELKMRIKWHITQPHTASAITSGFLSTLRATISALLYMDYSSRESAINSYMDEHALVEWNPSNSLEEAEIIERATLSKGYFPLNIRNNTAVSRQLRNQLTTLRKEHKK